MGFLLAAAPVIPPRGIRLRGDRHVRMWTPANNLEQERLDKLNRLIELGISPYPNRVKFRNTRKEATGAFEAAESANHDTPDTVPVSAAGRTVRQTLKGKVTSHT